MADNSNNLLEQDAVPTTSQVARRSPDNEIIESISTPTGNNSMVLSNQTNTGAVLTFEKCSGITLGTVINMGWAPGMANGNKWSMESPSKAPVVKAEDKIGKTPTIKKMMDSDEQLSPAFLDMVSGNFGSRWRDFTILLNIDYLFVDRMYEDHFGHGGTKEVSLLRSRRL